MKTYSPKPDHIERAWFVVDADGQVLGRLATEVATLLRGKHKPMFAPHMDTGDHVIVINADKVALSGNKAKDKYAYRHSGYPGGITAVAYGDLIATRPIAAIERAVRGMLPKNSLGRQMIKKLHVVPGPEHPHAAQKPVALQLGERPAWTGLPTPTPAPVRKVREQAPAVEEAAPAAEPAAQKPATAKEPSAAEETVAKKPAAKKTTAKKPAAAKETTAKETTAKEPAAPKKTTAKKTTAKKTTAKKTTAKKTTAKKSAAKQDEE
jgi:large subunit ribosomal protein L13